MGQGPPQWSITEGTHMLHLFTFLELNSVSEQMKHRLKKEK